MTRLQQETRENIKFVVDSKGWEWLAVYTGYTMRQWHKLWYEPTLTLRRHWLLSKLAKQAVEEGKDVL